MLCGLFSIILKVNKTFNAGEAATSNSDLPPTYQEATNSRPTCSLYIREPLPPKYTDIFSDTQRSQCIRNTALLKTCKLLNSCHRGPDVNSELHFPISLKRPYLITMTLPFLEVNLMWLVANNKKILDHIGFSFFFFYQSLKSVSFFDFNILI